MTTQPVLLAGRWQPSQGTASFTAVDPKTKQPLPESYPVSPWSEIAAALDTAAAVAMTVRSWPGERFAKFLERYADRIDARAAELIAMAHAETGLPVTPRLKDAELPRTSNQLRQAAAAARDGSWKRATIDSKANIRSQMEPIGPVAVFGPNNFPFAFNGMAGGDFAAAVAAGNPVIAKGHSSHPGTTRLLAEEAQQAATDTDMPPGFVQLIYRTSHADGAKLAGDPRLGAIGYTGSRSAGTVLKQAADAVGKPIYLELSSINPVFVLPGATTPAFAEQYAGSCLMGTGQFCTNPGLVFLLAGPATEVVITDIAQRFQAAANGVLLGAGVLKNLSSGVQTLRKHGAELLAGGEPDAAAAGYCYRNTLLRTTVKQFLAAAEALQTEAFGNAGLIVVADSVDELFAAAKHLEGNLTGCIYSAADGSDDAFYTRLEPWLRSKVGRLLNDKMPTGVAVSPAMNHGGPFPATGHPGFTAVGIPAAIARFSMLACYDGIRPHRLPAALQNRNPTGSMWRLVDGAWTQGDVAG
jgi:alpha-ketoglutaric semialdehyde dehydrogenase